MRTLIFDIETNGLLDTMNMVHSLCIMDVDSGASWSCTDQDYYTTTGTNVRSIKEGLAILADADVIVGHNIIKFDIPAINLIYPNWRPKGKVRDTLVMARLFWTELAKQDKSVRGMAFPPYDLPKHLTGRYGLEAFGYRLGLHKGDYSKDMKAAGLDPWGQWNPQMQAYCELDVEVTKALYDRCLKELEKNSEQAVELEHRVQEIIYLQELNGWTFDVKAGQQLYSKLVRRKAQLEHELQDVFKPWYVPSKVATVKGTRRMQLKDEPWGIKEHTKTGEPVYHKAEYQAGAIHGPIKLTEFNPSSRVHIANRLKVVLGWEPLAFSHDGKATVDDEILGKLPWPEAKLISKYLMVTKRLGQLGEGPQAWLKKVKADGRLYGSVQTNGAVTGRMTHNGPNLAQVPASYSAYGEECRSCFTARKGWKLVGTDADGIEGCCLAGYMSKFDKGRYIETVTQGDKAIGTDLHSMNAKVIGLDPLAKYDVYGSMITGREIAKTFFYAFLYGAGVRKLGLILGQGQKAGKAAREALLEGFPALNRIIGGITITVARKGYVIGLDGRRIYARTPNAALNTLLQGAGAAVMKQALVFLYDDLEDQGLTHGVDYAFVGNIHDEIQLECPPENAQVCGETAANAIRKAGEHFNFPCPMSGSFKVGFTWADTH